MKPKKHKTCFFCLLAPNTMLVSIQDHMMPRPHAASCTDAAFVDSGSGSPSLLLCLPSLGLFTERTHHPLTTCRPSLAQGLSSCLDTTKTEPWAITAPVEAMESAGRAGDPWLGPSALLHKRHLRGQRKGCTASEAMALGPQWP